MTDDLLPVLASREVAVTDRMDRMFPQTITTRLRGVTTRRAGPRAPRRPTGPRSETGPGSSPRPGEGADRGVRVTGVVAPAWTGPYDHL